jgi:drug/metabolite transporter (DMT)-like permease
MVSFVEKTDKRTIDFMLLGILACLWGSSYLFIKVAVVSIPPITLIAIRVVIAAAFLLTVMWGQGARFPNDWQIWRLLLIQAFFNSIASWTVLAWGEQYVDSALAGVLNSTSPIFVLICTVFINRHEVMNGWKLVGVLVGMVGVVMIVGIDTLGGIGKQASAQLAVLLGAMLYAGAALHGKRLSALSPIVVSAGTMLWATLFLVPLSLAVDRPWTLIPTGDAVFAAIALGVLCTGVALILYFRLVRTLGSMGVASQSYLRAGVSVLLGIVVLGEHITVPIGLGLCATIVGVIAINIRGGSKQ